MPPTAEVTLIIPARNSSSTLDETLASVVGQTHTDWVALVVDDGSADDTLDKLHAWTLRDNRIRCVSQDHRGVSGARNHGLQLTSSPWIVFLDSDDLILPGHLEAMLVRARDQAGVTLVHCGLRRMGTDGRLGEPEFAPRGRYFEHLAKYNCFAAPHVCLVSREAVIDAGAFDESMDIGEEWDLWQRLARIGTGVAYVDAVFSIYRMRPGSVVRQPGRLMSGGERVIVRGHGPDPRVRNPDPEFVNGVAEERRDSAMASLLLWASGVAIGAGEDITQLVPWMTADTTRALLGMDAGPGAETFAHGVLVGSCSLKDRWQALWRDRMAEGRRLLGLLPRQTNRDAWSSAFFSALSSMYAETSSVAPADLSSGDVPGPPQAV